MGFKFLSKKETDMKKLRVLFAAPLVLALAGSCVTTKVWDLPAGKIGNHPVLPCALAVNSSFLFLRKKAGGCMMIALIEETFVVRAGRNGRFLFW
jgi:hypothetical protein